jgi:uncharacterized protein (AIM24 family)
MSDVDSLNKIVLIGKESQIVHIILKKNDKINVNKNFITYASSENLDEIVYKNVDSLIRPTINVSNSEQLLKKVDNESLVRLKNKENNIEYVGLSKGGKIMKISPVLYNNLYVKLDNILAFNESIQLLKDNEVDNKFSKLMQRPNLQFGFRELVDTYLFNKNEFCLVKSKLDGIFILNVSSYLDDFMFISGKSNLIEKRLGENESMIIMGNSLVAFEQSITFSNISKSNTNNKYVNNINDIIVEGPGLIIFEVTERKVPINYPKGYMIMIPIALFILEILAQLILHYNLRQNVNQ